jgi:hypothetical protein
MGGSDSSAARNPALFQVAGRVVTRNDVVTSASHRGALVAPWRAYREGVASEQKGVADGLAVDEAATERIADEWRYARRLLTAEETEAWFAARGLEVDDLDAYARREHWRERVGARMEGAPPPMVVDDAFRAYLAMSGDLGRQAEELARRLAVLEEVAASARGAEADVGRLEATYRSHAKDVLTPIARERLLESMRLPLTRVVLEAIEVDTLDAAHELALCIRADGRDLASLSLETGRPRLSRACFVDDMDEALQGAVLSAAAGDVLDPIATEAGFQVCRLVSKTEPSAADPEVLRRVDREVLDAHFGELVARRVRWMLRDDPGE